MAVNEPEKLVRGMYDASVDRPVIVQENDVDGDFTSGSPGGIPAHLQELIQYQSVDVEPEDRIEEVFEIDAAKVTEENPQSRFRVVDTPTLAPGTCILCKSSGGDGRQFVDLGIQVTWVGALYFCTFCVTEAAKLLGLENMQAERDRINAMWDVTSEMNDEYAKMAEDNHAYRVLLRDHLAGNCVPVADSLENAEADDADAIADARNSVSEPEPPDSDEPDADESVAEQGPDDLPATSGDEPKRPPIRKRRPGQSAK